ncbi:granzyme K-like [Colias croceus]|uniref:granzyme K-like n=1 Tax=Colias crocea TaxID=72248 RepID=UPI001E27B83E|nr:granzyme K-like [Colias croceus]
MDGKKTRYNVLYMIAHQSLRRGMKNGANDIGLMKNEEVKHVTYAKLSAVDYTTFIGLEALSVGYGLMNTDNGLEAASSGNNTLQILEVMFTKCIDRNRYGRSPAMCTTPKCGAKNSICPGDSGGPIIHKSGVVAVHSTGVKCQSPYYSPRQFRRNLGVAVPVSPFFSWILEQMRLGSV